MRVRGFTLIELMIVVAIIAIIAAIAIPGLLRSRISTNESATIGTLKTIASAEAQFKQTGAVDLDSDGEGEYGFLSEVSGISTMRVAGGLGTRKFDPPSLPAILGIVTLSAAAKSGYEFRLYLPTASGPAIAQSTQTPPNGVPADANVQELRFGCYAWPSSVGQTGRRAFIVDSASALLATPNVAAAQGYSGKTTAPPPQAAYDSAGANPANLNAGLAIQGLTASDGGVWAPAQ